jgi:transposase-like protein
MESPLGSCPRCGSKKFVKIYNPKVPVWETSWKCSKCGYEGVVEIEDVNLEKQVKNLKKMDKLSKKLMKGQL